MSVDATIQRRFRFVSRGGSVPYIPKRACTRADLAALFRDLGFTAGVEIGTYRGQFAEILCAANPALHLTCVDPWAAYEQKSQRWMDRYYHVARQRLRGKPVTILRKPSLEALQDIADGSVHFVYVDGNHAYDYAAPDIIYWARKVRPGGIVAVHDYDASGNGPDVLLAVDAYTRAHHIDPWYVTREQDATAFWVQR